MGRRRKKTDPRIILEGCQKEKATLEKKLKGGLSEENEIMCRDRIEKLEGLISRVEKQQFVGGAQPGLRFQLRYSSPSVLIQYNTRKE